MCAFSLDQKLNHAFELFQSSMSATQRQFANEVLYTDYMSSEESDYEVTETPLLERVKGNWPAI